MQQKAVLWITDAFLTLPSEGIKAITGCHMTENNHLII